MRREEETMKETKAMNSILVGLLLMVAVEAQAVDYKSTYKGGRPQPTYIAPATGTVSQAPTATFQSTSAMPVMMSTESMLNSDGTVNTEAYGVGQDGMAQAPGRGHIRKITNPDSEDNDDVENPLGDGLLALMFLACAYAISKVSRTRKEGFAQ